jgi:hypothetical protein
LKVKIVLALGLLMIGCSSSSSSPSGQQTGSDAGTGSDSGGSGTNSCVYASTLESSCASNGATYSCSNPDDEPSDVDANIVCSPVGTIPGPGRCCFKSGASCSSNTTITCPSGAGGWECLNAGETPESDYPLITCTAVGMVDTSNFGFCCAPN